MSYREKAARSFEESLRASGLKESRIKDALIGFYTGYEVGKLTDYSEDAQESMVNALLQDEIVN